MVAVLLSPVTPALSRLVYQQLGYSDADFQSLSWADTQWGGEFFRLMFSMFRLYVLIAVCMHSKGLLLATLNLTLRTSALHKGGV